MQHYENVKQCLAKHNIPQGRAASLRIKCNCLKLYHFLELKRLLSVEIFSDVETKAQQGTKFSNSKKLIRAALPEFAEIL
jgi:hypothetical protein